VLKQLAPILLIGTALETVWLATLSLGPLRGRTGPFLGLMAVAFALCLWAYLRAPLSGKRDVWIVLAFALLFRLTVLPSSPWQSEDIYRYIWDARVAAAGLDPFAHAPQDPELEDLRDDRIYPMLNSKPYRTAYPPVSQLLFRAGHGLFGESVVAMKAVFSLLEFGALLLTWRLLAGMRLPLEPLFLMAWNPFFVFEFSHSGHSDSGMMFLMVASVWLLHKGRRAAALLSHAGAVLSKLHPALWYPLLLRRAGWKATLAGMASGAILASIYFEPSSLISYVRTLRLYYRLFEFNAGIHYLACAAGRALLDASWEQQTGPFLAAALLAVCAVVWSRFPIRDELGLMHAGFWLLTADLCFATTVHPWYLSWAAFALPFLPYAFMTWWTGAAFLSYAAYQYRPVYEPAWVLVLEYVPMYLLMFLEIRKGGPRMERLRAACRSRLSEDARQDARIRGRSRIFMNDPGQR